MTKHIFLSAIALLSVLVCISSALESQDESLMANELASREARAAEPQNGRKKDAGKKKLGKRRRNNKGKKKKSQIGKKNHKGKKKDSQGRRNKNNLGGKGKKGRRNPMKGKKKGRKVKGNKKKGKEGKKTQNKGKGKESNNKLKKQTDRDGNIIICPVCPQSAKTLCRSNKGRKMKKLSKKEKKLLKKIERTDRKIAKINKNIQKSRNGGEEVDDDKLCKTCCTPAPTPSPSPPSPATPPPPATPGPTVSPPCVDCLKEATTAMDVWRFQVTNFDKQCKRVEKQTSVASNKANKTSAFTDLSNLLTTLNCPSNMAEIDNLTLTLANCSAEVTAACKLTPVNQTYVDECKKKTKEYVVSTSHYWI